jgi:SpoVK/Ycf46/Vps4 family AAA+-type ATPase
MENIDIPLLLSCIRESNQVISNSLMERIDTVFKWEDLRVEPQVIHGMQLACAHLKYRFTIHQNIGQHYPYGSGVGVLMYGPPGTGKTMAAQVIANELQMDLYRVDLSQVSSKYIGETEKNLEQIFKEAEQANVILFFDEADSMFGKRTEVKDSNDKYANQETSYILQRIESYEGMVILATNFAQNFDSAFMRRITVSIHFSMPDEATRKLLWKDMLKHSDLVNDSSTIDALASQFELTGSNIKNIVRNAEFLALMSGRKLSITDIVMAIKIEYEKLGKICSSATFGMFMMYTY